MTNCHLLILNGHGRHVVPGSYGTSYFNFRLRYYNFVGNTSKLQLEVVSKER